MICLGIAHATILVANVDRALGFYVGTLELTVRQDRPDLGYPGAWLNLSPGQQIHLIGSRNGAPPPADTPGVDRHLALYVAALDPVRDALTRISLPFIPSRSGRRALFCRDPDGNALEFIEYTD